jgi:hypothetical protein
MLHKMCPMLLLHKPPKAPMLLQSNVLLWVHHTYMITPSTQASISQVQASMQVIQVCPCHLGLNALLKMPMLLLQSKASSKQATQPPCGHHEEVTKLSRSPMLQGRMPHKHQARSSNPRVSHLHMCMSIMEQSRVIHTPCTPHHMKHPQTWCKHFNRRKVGSCLEGLCVGMSKPNLS